MKRRGFVRGLLLAPAAQAALSAQQSGAPAQPAANPPAAAARNRQGPALLKVTIADVTSEAEQKYFSKAQYAALEKLAAVFMPPMKGNPGAIDAQAPLFLDFLISVSPAERQKL